MRRAPQLVAQDTRFAVPRTQVQAQTQVIAQVIQDAALRLHTIRARVLIGLHRIGGAGSGRVGQRQIGAVGGEQAMPAPTLDFVVRFIQLIKARAQTAIQMGKHLGVELVPGVRKGTRRRDAKDVAERVKDFIEGILERQFMTSQNHQTEVSKGEQALPREIFGPLPTRGNHDGTLQAGTDLRQEGLFFFCSINSSLQEFYC